MSEQYGPLRSTATRKPWPSCPDVVVWRCAHCGNLYQNLSPVTVSACPTCCGEPMERLESRPAADIPGLDMDYTIVGGLNANAVRVVWTAPEGARPVWILLKTFTGGYIKYLTREKVQPVVFPLADEDAYVYCDREECRCCVFRCKLGCVIYAWFETFGLVEVPLDRMMDYFQAGAVSK